MKTKYILILAITLLFGSSCSDFLEVVPVSKVTEGEVFTDITRAQQFLNPAYGSVRYRPWVSMESYTDNAVENNGPKTQAISGSTAENSPVAGEWNSAVAKINHVNEFLEKGFDVPYDAFSKETSKALQTRIRGEAYGLRAYYRWVLLKNFAGPSAQDGSMLGIPLWDNVLSIDEANNIARSSYLDSYNTILEDLDSALILTNVMRYEGKGDFDKVNFTGRICGEMIYALKARMALFASSEAFQQISKAEAAQVIYNAIKAIDGEELKSLQPFGDFKNNENNPDNLWRLRFETTNWYESNYLPPSLYGSGTCNPSQNLVDAFPDIYGFPISDPASVYDPTNPYEGRDPRFEKFIFHNGLNQFRDSTYIEVFDGGKDAIGGYTKRATRTGYYMKKYLTPGVNLNYDESGSRSARRGYAIFTRTGLYLDFAEAMLESYGPDGTGPGMAFNAKDAIQKVRERGGLVLDDYLEVASADVSKFRNMVRNERRIEFAFEGQRYYDVRRWKLPLTQLNAPVMGMAVEKIGDDGFTYAEKEVEKRNFFDYMYYNPIPRAEVLRSNALVQNAGWE